MAITWAFLQIYGMEWVAMILERNLDSQLHYIHIHKYIHIRRKQQLLKIVHNELD